MNYELPKLKAEIKIPDSYKPVDNIDINRIISRPDDIGFREEMLNFYKTNPKTKLLIDTLNPYSFIMISEISEYVPIDSNSFYGTIEYERNRSSSSPAVEDSTYYVGSKIDSVPNFKFLTSKYERKLNGRHRFSHLFIISSKNKTLGISFYSPTDEKRKVMRYIKTIKERKV
ncbi:MAG: hypothetical protein EOO44_17295 [Flavobacterium sp.]|nr:MAG: hypothetical protein EOO44_17295 [Flavobacterium sp.]